MINNELDVEAYRLQLARRSRVQLVDFLQPDAAERLRDCLAHEVHVRRPGESRDPVLRQVSEYLDSGFTSYAVESRRNDEIIEEFPSSRVKFSIRRHSSPRSPRPQSIHLLCHQHR